MALRGWVTAGLLSIVAATATAQEQAPKNAKADANDAETRIDAQTQEQRGQGTAQEQRGQNTERQKLPDALRVPSYARKPTLSEQVQAIRRQAELGDSCTPTIEELGALYRKMKTEKPVEQRQAEGRTLVRALDELITLMPICDDEVLARQMLDFGKAGDLYLGTEQYPKAVRAYMEAIKRSYRNEAEALRQGNESSASQHELNRIQALRGMSCAWFYEAKRSANSTYSHTLLSRAMDVRSSAYELVMMRRKDGRSAGTPLESTVDDMLQLGRMAAALNDDRSVAYYARLAAEEMAREEKEKQLRREMSLLRVYVSALEGVKSGQDMIDMLKRLDSLIRDPLQ